MGGVLDSTEVGFLYCKSETHWASLQKCKFLHGNKNRVKAFGFKAKKLALAA